MTTPFTKKGGAKHRPKHFCFCHGDIPWCQINQSHGPLWILWDVWEKIKKGEMTGSYNRSRLSQACSHLTLQGISTDPIIKMGNLDPRSVISRNPAHLSARVGEPFKPSSVVSLESLFQGWILVLGKPVLSFTCRPDTG